MVDAPYTGLVCEQAWFATLDEKNAVVAAWYARNHFDDARLQLWASRAWPTLEGAKILHLWSERQRQLGDRLGAEATLRMALALRIDRDPDRAINSALALLELVQSSRPAEESIKLAGLVARQAALTTSPLPREFTASALVELFIDLGELSAADAVIRNMDSTKVHILKDVATGRLQAAKGNVQTAATLFERASQPRPASSAETSWPLKSAIELVQAQLEAGRLAEARSSLTRAIAIKQQYGAPSADEDARLDAAEAAVLLAEGKVDAALATANRGLGQGPRDAARLLLLNVRGDALARRGDDLAAESAWRAAADSVEAWRASIPTTQLRSGLIARHRHALESWLDSCGKRGSYEGALEVTRRLLGRGLLDRIRQREANAPTTVDASLQDELKRLTEFHDLAATMSETRDLRDATDDLVAVMVGQRSVWAIRRVHGQWSIDRAGDREAILAMIDAYRRAPDERRIADELGAALFRVDKLPARGAPLVVLLDRELADVALAGLRVGGHYLVERNDILEVLAPELVFTALPADRWGPPVAIGDASGNLPSAAREAQAVAHALGITPQLGGQATRAAVTQAAAARVLHIATHSDVEDGRAALVLADGTLSTRDIVSLKVAPRLAVIATCRSQVDDDPATSLVAAFLAAGTPGVVGVKRALDDADSAALMADFYRDNGAADPLHGLAEAQRAAIAANRQPHAWATVSFFGVGGWINAKRN